MHNNEFDKLLKEKLSNVVVKPSEHLWSRIVTGIPRYSPWGQIFTPFVKIFLGSLVFVGAVVITTVSVLDNQKSSNAIMPAYESTLRGNQITHGQSFNIDIFELMPVINQSTIIEKTETTQLSPIDPEMLSFAIVREDNLIVDKKANNAVLAHKTSSVVELDFSQNLDEFPVKIKSIVGASLPVSEMRLNKNPISYSSALSAAIPHEYINTSELALNISYQPELYFFDSMIFEHSYALDHSLNLSIQYFTRDFFIEMGVSGTYVSHANTYQNTVEVRELVDSYEQVDSVHFVDVWDPITSEFITQPVFYTSVVNVYDENTVTDVVSKNDSYLYVQIPVFMGLRKDIRRFSIEAKTGFIFSSLLFTSEQNNIYSNEGTNILHAEQSIISLKRNRQYWSFLFGIGASYKLTSSAEMFVTPTYRYLLSPLYPGNNPSRKTPYAFGVQTGIRFIF